jgi:hypothetical protein
MSDRRIPEAVLAEIRARVPLREIIGRAVELRRSGRNWTGCCPFHGERTPSFHVYPDHFHCYGCGAHGDVIAFTARVERMTWLQAVQRLAGEAGVTLDAGPAPAPWTRPAAPPPPPPRRDDDAAERARRVADAAAIWNAAAPLADDGPGAAYLRGRGLWPLPECVRSELRDARLVYPPTREGEGGPWVHPAGRDPHPVLLARVLGPDATLRGVHRIFLAPREGGGFGKLPGVNAKVAKGLLSGAAVRLFPAAPVLGLAEGIETALAAHLLTGLPVWSCISTTFLKAVLLPPDVERVVVFADRDGPKRGAPHGPGLHAAWDLAARLKAEAVRTEIRLPNPPAGDYADVWAARGEGRAA